LVATPIFWFGLVLVYVFYFKLGIAPPPTGRIDLLVSPPRHITGSYLLDSLFIGDVEAFVSAASRLVLPVITLAFIVGASIVRMTYTSMRKVLAAPYILVGHAYGFSPRAMVYKFALKNALMPVLTLIGLQIGFLIGGVVLVEVVFSLPRYRPLCRRKPIGQRFCPGARLCADCTGRVLAGKSAR
jgi:peptide/nickel transport system permease protein